MVCCKPTWNKAPPLWHSTGHHGVMTSHFLRFIPIMIVMSWGNYAVCIDSLKSKTLSKKNLNATYTFSSMLLNAFKNKSMSSQWDLISASNCWCSTKKKRLGNSSERTFFSSPFHKRLPTCTARSNSCECSSRAYFFFYKFTTSLSPLVTLSCRFFLFEDLE